MSDPTPSYFSEFFQSPGNVSLMLGGAAIATALSFTHGLLGAAFPLLVTLGIEVIACLFVPDMTTFRRWADTQRKTRARMETTERLLREIQKRCSSSNQFQKYLESHRDVMQLVGSVLDIAQKRPGALGLEDRERIAVVPAEYLGLQLSLLVMDERSDAIDLREVNRKRAQIASQIEQPESGMDVQALERAHDEYAALIARHQRMQSKRSAIEAAMVSLPDQLSEIYQIVMGESSQTDGARLSDAIASLRLRQDIEAEIADDLSGAILDTRSPTKNTKNANVRASRSN